MPIVCLGELLVDFFPLELGKTHAQVTAFRKVPGGGPANVAVAAARLGAESAFIGKVGDDPFGRWLVDVLAAEGVDTRGMALDPCARTTLNILAQPDANHYDCLFYRNPGADTLLRADELDAALLASASAYHFGSLSLTDEPARGAALAAARMARAAGALVSFDVNYRPTLWADPPEAVDIIRRAISCADLLKVNEGELALLTGRQPDFAREGWQEDALASAARLLDLGPSLVIVTLGPRGALYRTREAGGYVPGFPVKTVDATGCGDAFIGGLLWQLTRDARLPGALRYANAVGALTATRQGVIPALPTAQEVETFLENRL